METEKLNKRIGDLTDLGFELKDDGSYKEFASQIVITPEMIDATSDEDWLEEINFIDYVLGK